MKAWVVKVQREGIFTDKTESLFSILQSATLCLLPGAASDTHYQSIKLNAGTGIEKYNPYRIMTRLITPREAEILFIPLLILKNPFSPPPFQSVFLCCCFFININRIPIGTVYIFNDLFNYLNNIKKLLSAKSLHSGER